MAEALLITRDDLVRFTAVNGNMDTDTFIQWIKVAQDIHIQNYTGTDLLEKIKTDIINNTIANKGIFKHSSENATNIDKNEVDFLIEKQRQLAVYYTERFIDYMSFNSALFPEYNTNSNGDVYPSSDSTTYTGWFL